MVFSEKQTPKRQVFHNYISMNIPIQRCFWIYLIFLKFHSGLPVWCSVFAYQNWEALDDCASGARLLRQRSPVPPSRHPVGTDPQQSSRSRRKGHSSAKHNCHLHTAKTALRVSQVDAWIRLLAYEVIHKIFHGLLYIMVLQAWGQKIHAHEPMCHILHIAA